MRPDFAGFVGCIWALEREIEDIRSKSHARFVGQAEVSPFGAAFRYVETGTLTLADGTPFHSTRSYLWAPIEDAIEIQFEDGRPFHTIDLTGGDAGHYCDPDQYDVAYSFENWPQWRARWRVRGPKKNYEMTSWYRKQVADAANGALKPL